MSEKPELRSPLMRIIMDDGSVHDVQTVNKDLVAWDRARHRHKWPALDDARNQWLTFIGWSAITREGLIERMTLDEFTDHCLECLPAPDDDEADDESGVGPTRRAPEPS